MRNKFYKAITSVADSYQESRIHKHFSDFPATADGYLLTEIRT